MIHEFTKPQLSLTMFWVSSLNNGELRVESNTDIIMSNITPYVQCKMYIQII